MLFKLQLQIDNKTLIGFTLERHNKRVSYREYKSHREGLRVSEEAELLAVALEEVAKLVEAVLEVDLKLQLEETHSSNHKEPTIADKQHQ